jgi:hypothetical protein
MGLTSELSIITCSKVRCPSSVELAVSYLSFTATGVTRLSVHFHGVDFWAWYRKDAARYDGKLITVCCLTAIVLTPPPPCLLALPSP